MTKNLPFPSVRKILAPGEEENLELEEEEEDAAAGAGSTDAFPPRAPGTLHLCLTVNQTHPAVWGALLVVACRHRCPVFKRVFDRVFLFSLSVLRMASSLIPAFLLHLQLRKVQLYQ